MKVYSLGELVCEFLWADDGMHGPFVSGAPAIAIDTLGRLGIPCGFFAAVGDDDFGRMAMERLARDGVDIRGVRALNDASTGLAFTRYAPDGSRRFIYYFKNEAPARFDQTGLDEDSLSDMTWLHISGNVMMFSQSVREAVERAVGIAARLGATVSFDPNVRSEMMTAEETERIFLPILKKTQVFFPSDGEIQGIFPGLSTREALDTLFSWGVREVVEKRGKAGCRVYRPGGAVDVEGFEVQEVDPTGCGDSFCAGYIAGALKGLDPARAARLANAVGAMAAARRGAMEGADSLEEVLKFGRFSHE